MNIVWLKLHYFLWFGSLSGVLPYVVVFGATHTQQVITNIGVSLITFRFCTFLSKPLFCLLADKYNSHKLVLLLSALCTYIGHSSLLIIPYLRSSLKWPLFCIFVLLAHCGTGCVISLTDSIVMKEVTKAKVDYGKVRVFGALGWGFFSILNGLLNDYTTSVMPSYFAGVIVAGILKTIDLIMIYATFEGKTHVERKTPNEEEEEERARKEPECINLTREDDEDAQPQSVCSEMVYAFKRYPSISRYVFLALIIGVLQAFHWSYFYLFIKGISFNDTKLMGLATGVECFLGEVPFFILAGAIVKKLGASLSLVVTFGAFTIRYLLYAYCINEDTRYWVLAVELLQGPAFGLFYCVITAIAQDFSVRAARAVSEREQKDRKEVEGRNFATLQGIMSGAFEGAGLGLGSLAGGIITDQWMITGVWLVGAALAFIALIFEMTVQIVSRICVKN